ncbi:DNA repair protein RecO [Mariniblastus fucicola]|uniref:DNA repair protein RecO n=1 Tax=Mariniblastus fucicola TaxID=980251 RepID=A0A5B9PCC9_9BACT|nr:DNA repair protein RecO [Mariniblastus fucicola]QEG22176.1 DNA repair protein RecO [Mariniblastus fucicola]
MEPEKTSAIILRVVDFSESSCVVTMFTRSLGKITVMAKGARRPKGPFESAIDVLAICRIVFLHKASDAMDLLTEAKLDRRFRSSSRDLQRLYCGYYLVELLRTLTDEADPYPEVFDMALDAIEKIDGEGSPAETVFKFECGLLQALGHSPMLTRCVTCGINKTRIDRVHFGLADGGLLCGDCCRGKAAIKILGSDCLQFLLDQFGVTLETNDDKAKDTTETEAQSPQTGFHLRKGYREARQLMNQYLNHLVGHQIRLQKYIENL